jgi:4-amino-4-deoxy-L-arabinose transferase-like glycosyltransferase
MFGKTTKSIHRWERGTLIALLLLAWTLRWVALLEVPPGWRDDDLIEVYTFSREILQSGPVLYFSGAEGHEPLYHTLRAPLIAIAGINIAAVRWLAAVCGLFSVLLTWAVGRRLFTREVGVLSAGLVAVSFWALMYSRVAIRHIAILPPLLVAIYWGWRQLQEDTPPPLAPLGIGLGTGAALMTYYAGRLVPPLLLAVLPLIGWKRLFPPSRSPHYEGGQTGQWKGYLLGVAGGLLLAVPMFWMIHQMSGSDARLSTVGVPLNALREGDLGPLLNTTWTTLGMFHATGDPEWLYNIARRPLFSWFGAAIFYLGIITQLAHLNRANTRLILLWLAAGLAPAFISYPASSLSHTILAMPAVYILMALPTKVLAQHRQWTTVPLILLTLATVAIRDIPDYFVTWPQASMVRFLYRGDYRDLAQYLDAHPQIEDAVVSSFLYGPWDRLALETDMEREDVRLRWVNPTHALVIPKPPDNAAMTPFYFQEEQHPHPALKPLLASSSPAESPDGLKAIVLSHPIVGRNLMTEALSHQSETCRKQEEHVVQATFEAALQLHTITVSAPHTLPSLPPEITIATMWEVTGPLPLPPEKLLPNPPPPGVYNGPRLKVFTHLLTPEGNVLAGDDGLWVDPYTLRVGDYFIQWHHLAPAPDIIENLDHEEPGTYYLALGLYDPLTGQRWHLENGADRITITLDFSRAFGMTSSSTCFIPITATDRYSYQGDPEHARITAVPKLQGQLLQPQ